MTTITPTSAPPSTATGRVVLRQVSWEGYLHLLSEVADDPVRLTYGNGVLEIEMPSELHELLTRLASAMVSVALEDAGIDYQPLGNTTWRHPEKQKGVEADECFYIQNLSAIVDRRQVDLQSDPPPDLAIETEVTSSSLNKAAIFAAIGVPELWRISQLGEVRFFSLNRSGEYEQTMDSRAVIGLTAETLTRHVQMLRPLGTLVHSQVVRAFRQSIAGSR